MHIVSRKELSMATFCELLALLQLFFTFRKVTTIVVSTPAQGLVKRHRFSTHNFSPLTINALILYKFAL